MRPTGTSRARIMSDVAARAGVSHQTVSRVINGHPNVAPRTRARVKLAIAELGYRPNIAARALVTGSTRTIGLVTMHLDQYGPRRRYRAGEGGPRGGLLAQRRDPGPRDRGEMRDAVDRFVAQKVDAVVALSTYDAAAEALGRSIRRSRSSPCRWARTETGRRSAWTRRRAPAWPPATCSTSGTAPCTTSRARRDSQEARARVAGWRAELDDVDAPVPGYQSGDWTPAAGYAAGERLVSLIRGGEPVSAVFVANDQMGLGLLAALHRAGLDVPGDVSVVGFDDLPEAPYFNPPLTTVRQDFAELGRRGVQLLLARLGGEELHLDPVPATLVVRSSTAPAKREGPAPGPAGDTPTRRARVVSDERPCRALPERLRTALAVVR